MPTGPAPQTPSNPEILLVDDSPDDAELVRRALVRGGRSASILRVDTEAAFRRALGDRAWDLVIADYSQPSFGALAVLALLEEVESDLSCIVISGVAGEDRAVETMRAGAKDFVSKDRLQRLAPAVQRELEEASWRRERARLADEETARDARLRALGAHFLDILQSEAFAQGRASEVYRALTELVARGLDVERVSIWLFDETRTGFTCVDCFDRVDARHSTGPQYGIDERPEYFEALERNRFVEAHEVSSAPRGPSAPPRAIGSQLDVAIRLRGMVVGALCVDHLGTRRRWRSDEQLFAGSIADLASLALETQERQRAERALRESEMQLQQSQKMEAIGRLAGGVAHDFNNLLTAIIGYSQIATIRPDVPEPVLVDLREITSAAHRAAALTRQLLAFSRRQVLEPRVLNMNAVISGIEPLLRRLISEDIALRTDLDTNLAAVLADPSQLEQVILNLAVNARDALPDGGRIIIRTRMTDRVDQPLDTPWASKGPFVVLEVTDDGIGMDDETRLHIFEPFYTTKELGTGLGLSTVYGIVRQSGGEIAVRSAQGQGTTFAIFLPVATGGPVDADAVDAPAGPGGSETILVVEDDDRVRFLACRVLRAAGYTVLEASAPDTAMALVEQHQTIHLLLTDQVMPVMRGAELYAHLQARRPALRVLYMSGYRHEDERTGQEEAFLPKPFTPDMLGVAVRRVLDGASRAV